MPPSTTQWGASKASGSIYTPQTGVANHTVREAVAKQGFLIKSSAGKKDSVRLHTSALGIVHMTYWSALLVIMLPNLTPDLWG